MRHLVVLVALMGCAGTMPEPDAGVSVDDAASAPYPSYCCLEVEGCFEFCGPSRFAREFCEEAAPGTWEPYCRPTGQPVCVCD